MRPPVLIIAALLATTGCRCEGDDGWPHLEDQLWRVALDPDGAHPFRKIPGHKGPLVLLERGDLDGADALLLGNRGAERSPLRAVEESWNPCPSGPRRLRAVAAQALQPPQHAGLAWLGPSTRVEIPTPPANRSGTVAIAQEILNFWSSE